jgi:hypothetical protein
MPMKKSKNAADLEFPATDQANAPARAEFKLGICHPDQSRPARNATADADTDARDTQAVNQYKGLTPL